MVYRIHKTDGYSVMSNYHLNDSRLSWKAKGVLSLLLSLQGEYDYSVKSIMTFSSDGRDCTSTAIEELEKFLYIKREQVFADGKFRGYNYDVYELPFTAFPFTENPSTRERKDLLKERGNSIFSSYNSNSCFNCYTDDNTVNTVLPREEEKENIQEKKKRENFQKPTVAEIQEYCAERGNGIDAENFFDFYQSKGWKVGTTPMKDWKACVRTWEQKRKAPHKDDRETLLSFGYSQEYVDSLSQEELKEKVVRLK